MSLVDSKESISARDPPADSSASPIATVRWRDDIERFTLVILGLASVVPAVIVLANPALSLRGLLYLVIAASALSFGRIVVTGGPLFKSVKVAFPVSTWGNRLYRRLGLLGLGVIAVGLALGAALDPALTTAATIFVLTIALVAQGLGRMGEGLRPEAPGWLRGSSFATGALIVILVVGALAFEGVALYAFAVLVGVILLVNGIETVVAGFRPTDPRQFVLLKLILFAAFYGLVLINWIDLFGKEVPGYGIWLVLSYMAPFGVLLVFQGWESWPLAVSLGLLVSLMNDVGYFFIGNLLFGFHVALGPWIAGQLGFQGNAIVTYFEGGRFSIAVTSWMMGLSIYARAAVVVLILYYWWRHPTGLIARSAIVPTPTST
ncbi:MAG: hypothetical protein WB778_10365 [Thermoplasmata archaeon]